MAPGSREARSADIRSVDFKNFAYRPSCTNKLVRVKEGKYEVHRPPERLLFRVVEVVYGDLTGDGRDEAVVTTYCDTGGSGGFSEGYVYTMRGRRAAMIVRLKGGDRALGGIHMVSVVNGTLVVARLAPETPEGPACCPKYIETSTYQLKGRQLVQEGTRERGDYELLPSSPTGQLP